MVEISSYGSGEGSGRVTARPTLRAGAVEDAGGGGDERQGKASREGPGESCSGQGGGVSRQGQEGGGRSLRCGKQLNQQTI